MDKITYTTILHSARENLGITTNEYCVADIIYHLSNNPKSKIQGWCYASRQTIGKFIGVTKQSIFSTIKRLEKKNIIEKDDETKYLRTTEKWFNIVVINRLKHLGKETIPSVKKTDGVVKKTDGIGKETLPNIDKDIDKDKNTEAFDKFYLLYPKKKSRITALKAFQKLSPNPSLLKIILDDVEKKKNTKQWKKDDGQFIPYPATYLNQHQWTDEEVKTTNIKKEIYGY